MNSQWEKMHRNLGNKSFGSPIKPTAKRKARWTANLPTNGLYRNGRWFADLSLAPKARLETLLRALNRSSK